MRKLLENKKLRVMFMVVKAFTTLLVCIIVSIIFVQRVSNNKITLGGYSIYTIVSESMLPKYEIGDMIISKKTSLDNIKLYDDVVYMGLKGDFQDKIVTHQVIDIKNSLLKGGLKEGISTTIEKGIELGKSITGIFTGKFENVSQAQNAIKNGGIIDGISDVLDSTLNYTVKKGLIPSSIGTLIRQGKNVILDNVSNNIETEFANQLDNIGKLGKYENNWKNYYQNQDFDGMEREYEKIKDRLKQTLPLEETLKQARQIENLHLIIKNNGHNFNLTEEQKKLAEILIK